MLPSRIKNKRGLYLAVVVTSLVSIGASLVITRVCLFLAGETDPHRLATALTICVVVPLLIAPVLSYWGFGQMLKLARATAKLEELSQADYLTGIYNRRHFLKLAERELSLFRRHGLPLSLLLLDLDHFKRVNDSYGHLAGDKVLAGTARLIKHTVRTTDIIGRFGGEEFIIMAPNTDKAGAVLLAERIRRAFEKASFLVGEQGIQVTASIGCVSMQDTELTLEELIRAADKALYNAKQKGRDMVEMASSAWLKAVDTA